MQLTERQSDMNMGTNGSNRHLAETIQLPINNNKKYFFKKKKVVFESISYSEKASMKNSKANKQNGQKIFLNN